MTGGYKHAVVAKHWDDLQRLARPLLNERFVELENVRSFIKMYDRTRTLRIEGLIHAMETKKKTAEHLLTLPGHSRQAEEVVVAVTDLAAIGHDTFLETERGRKYEAGLAAWTARVQAFLAQVKVEEESRKAQAKVKTRIKRINFSLFHREVHKVKQDYILARQAMEPLTAERFSQVRKINSLIASVREIDERLQRRIIVLPEVKAKSVVTRPDAAYGIQVLTGDETEHVTAENLAKSGDRNDRRRYVILPSVKREGFIDHDHTQELSRDIVLQKAGPRSGRKEGTQFQFLHERLAKTYPAHEATKKALRRTRRLAARARGAAGQQDVASGKGSGTRRNNDDEYGTGSSSGFRYGGDGDEDEDGDGGDEGDEDDDDEYDDDSLDSEELNRLSELELAIRLEKQRKRREADEAAAAAAAARPICDLAASALISHQDEPEPDADLSTTSMASLGSLSFSERLQLLRDPESARNIEPEPPRSERRRRVRPRRRSFFKSDATAR